MQSLFTPYEDQEKSISAIQEKILAGEKRILLVAATGSGKTVMSSETKRRLYMNMLDTEGRECKMLFVVHRNPLIEQTISTLVKTGFHKSDIGVIAGKYKENRQAPIQILSIATASRRNFELWFDWDVCIFDEGHTTGFQTWGRKLHKSNPNKIIIYLTATTWRLKKTEAFTQLVPLDNWIFAPLPGKLMEMGRLSPCRYFKEVEIDTSSVRQQAGDFRVNELSTVSRDAKVVQAGLDFWDAQAPGESVAVFCVDVKHGKYVAELARQHGRKVAIVTAETPEAPVSQKSNPPEGTREWYYQKLADGVEIDMLVSIDCISEGFDVPTLRCGWGLRATKSPSKFYQQLGRILRKAKGKDHAIFLDQAGNLLYETPSGTIKGRFLPVEELEEEHFVEYPDFKKGDRPPPRICVERDEWSWEIPPNPKGCFNIVGSKELKCPHCGYILPVRKRRKAKSEIIEVRDGDKKKKKKTGKNTHLLNDRAFQMFFVDAMNKCYLYNYHPYKAFYDCQSKFGKLPSFDFCWRWVSYMKSLSAKNGNPPAVTPEGIDEWLKAVSLRRPDDDVVGKWRHRFDPPVENIKRETPKPVKKIDPKMTWSQVATLRPTTSSMITYAGFNESPAELMLVGHGINSRTPGLDVELRAAAQDFATLMGQQVKVTLTFQPAKTPQLA